MAHRGRICWLGIFAVLLCLVRPGEGGAQDAVWNLRTPEWRAAWVTLPDGESAQLDLIRVASRLVAYSGRFFPVTPMGEDESATIPGGHVPVDLAWFAAEPGVLAFGVARGWAHLILGHRAIGDPGTAVDATAWRAGLRYASGDETAADAWAGRFLADFGYATQEVLAGLCKVDDSGARAEAVAGEVEAITGLRPVTPCDGPSVVEAAGSCDDRLDACRLSVDLAVQACHDICRIDDCALACASGSYDQCNSCTASCGRRCNSNAATMFDQCGVVYDNCEDEQAAGGGRDS